MRIKKRLPAAFAASLLALICLGGVSHAQSAAKTWSLGTERGKAYLTYFTINEQMPQRIGTVHHSLFCDHGMIGLTLKDGIPRVWRVGYRDFTLKTDKAIYTVKGDIAPGAGNGGGPMLDITLTRAQIRAAVESAESIEVSHGTFKAQVGLRGTEKHRAAFLKGCG